MSTIPSNGSKLPSTTVSVQRKQNKGMCESEKENFILCSEEFCFASASLEESSGSGVELSGIGQKRSHSDTMVQDATVVFATPPDIRKRSRNKRRKNVQPEMENIHEPKYPVQAPLESPVSKRFSLRSRRQSQAEKEGTYSTPPVHRNKYDRADNTSFTGGMIAQFHTMTVASSRNKWFPWTSQEIQSMKEEAKAKKERKRRGKKKKKPTTKKKKRNKSKSTSIIRQTFKLSKAPSMQTICKSVVIHASDEGEQNEGKNAIPYKMHFLSRFDPVRYYTKHHSYSPQVRALLLDWLHDLNYELVLPNRIVHLATWLLDHYVWSTNHMLDEDNIQCMGAAAFWIASKYECQEIHPLADDLCWYGAGSFKTADLCRFERLFLHCIQFQLETMTSYDLVRLIQEKCNVPSTSAWVSLCVCLLEICLQEDISFQLCYAPKLVVSTCCHIALEHLDEISPHVSKDTIHEAIQQVTELSARDLQVMKLGRVVHRHVRAYVEKSSLGAIRNKWKLSKASICMQSLSKPLF